jgi:hypothetical protein
MAGVEPLVLLLPALLVEVEAVVEVDIAGRIAGPEAGDDEG